MVRLKPYGRPAYTVDTTDTSRFAPCFDWQKALRMSVDELSWYEDDEPRLEYTLYMVREMVPVLDGESVYGAIKEIYANMGIETGPLEPWEALDSVEGARLGVGLNGVLGSHLDRLGLRTGLWSRPQGSFVIRMGQGGVVWTNWDECAAWAMRHQRQYDSEQDYKRGRR